MIEQTNKLLENADALRKAREQEQHLLARLLDHAASSEPEQVLAQDTNTIVFEGKLTITSSRSGQIVDSHTEVSGGRY